MPELGDKTLSRVLNIDIGGQSHQVNCTTNNGEETCVVDGAGAGRICQVILIAVVVLIAVLVIRCLLSRGSGGSFDLGGAPVRTVESLADYQNLLAQNKPMFIQFYAPWCGHCKQAAPAFEEAARMAQSNSEVVFVKVNGDAAPEVAQAHGVEGFPTFKLVSRGGVAKDVSMPDRSARSMHTAATSEK